MLWKHTDAGLFSALGDLHPGDLVEEISIRPFHSHPPRLGILPTGLLPLLELVHHRHPLAPTWD